MNKKEQIIIEKILSDSSTADITAEELEKELDEELKKPEPDYDLVEELTEAIIEARGQAVRKIDVQSEISEIKRRANAEEKKFRCPKRVAAVSAACLVLVGANTFSIASWGMNIFSAIVEISKGGISIDFGKQEQQEVIKLPTSESDPYGIKTKCAEYEVYPEAPDYLPQGFELVDFQSDVNEVSTELQLFYKRDKVKLNISYIQYNNSEDIPPIGIPTDTYNIMETKVNERTMFILKEDNQFTATYLSNNVVYVIFSDGLDYDECQKIVESIN